MRADSIAYVVAGMCFGVILGWIIGTQQALRARPASTVAASAPTSQAAAPARQAPPLDEAKVQQLTELVTNDPKNAVATVQLADAYFDAERWDDAITWYERALAIDPASVDASTDLGISYFYSDRPDRALAQFERSLKLDPNHTKTMLNKGIVLAFGKEDIRGATEEWKKVVTLAPSSVEGQAARKFLEGVAAAHGASTPSNQ